MLETDSARSKISLAWEFGHAKCPSMLARLTGPVVSASAVTEDWDFSRLAVCRKLKWLFYFLSETSACYTSCPLHQCACRHAALNLEKGPCLDGMSTNMASKFVCV